MIIIEELDEDNGKYECVEIKSEGEDRCDDKLLVKKK